MPPEFVHQWRPIERPSDPEALAAQELRALQANWAEQRRRLEELGAFQPFWDRMVRRWSIETGIIERIYTLSPGATELFVQRGFHANLIHHEDTDTEPERLVEILEDHRSGVAMVMDLIGGKRELSVNWIKQLHELLCRHQPIVTAREQGPLGRLIEIEFEHGVFKRLPNNPTLAAGVHAYCPPEQTASEMDRLIEIYRTLPAELPEVRSAWLHHAFTQIHPFQDGNGRVARALASIDLIRAGLFPLLVERSQRDSEYIPALRAADAGRLDGLVRFIAERQIEAVVQAISEAAGAIEEMDSIAAVVEAARQRVEQRAQGEFAKTDRLVRYIGELARLAETELEAAGRLVTAALPSVRTTADRWDANTTPFGWSAAIAELARTQRFIPEWQSERRTWARLELDYGRATDLVIVLVFVARSSPGLCVGGAFVVHRDSAAVPMSEGRTVVLPTRLVLVAGDDEESQTRRFLEWLDRAIALGLAQWKQTL